jgi:hypothetical protein
MSEALERAHRVDPVRVGLAWLIAVGVDLLLNAGLFARILDPSREPALLTERQLALRIPFAYAALALGVACLAWILALSHTERWKAVRFAAIVGFVVGVLGVGSLWTAIDITGAFVATGILTTGAEATASAVVLTSPRSNASLSWRIGAGFFILAGAGVILSNVLRH